MFVGEIVFEIFSRIEINTYFSPDMILQYHISRTCAGTLNGEKRKGGNVLTKLVKKCYDFKKAIKWKKKQ